MKKASLHSIFWIILIVAVSFLIAYTFIRINIKNAALISRDLKEKADKYKIPVFEIRDAKYSESGSVAEVTLNLINMGDEIQLKGWLLQFLTPDGKTICRTTIFTGDPTESGRISTDIYIPSRNATLEYGDFILSGEVAEVTFTLISTCLNETINYTRSGEKMIIRLTIPPTASSVITTCTVDPYTGFATCTE